MCLCACARSLSLLVGVLSRQNNTKDLSQCPLLLRGVASSRAHLNPIKTSVKEEAARVVWMCLSVFDVDEVGKQESYMLLLEVKVCVSLMKG